jgi:cell division protein ZapA
VNERDQKAVVHVRIGGEEYAIRADASADYTRECAAYVDSIVSEIRRQSSQMDSARAVLLASLSLADQLFRARAELEATRGEASRRTAALAAEIEAALGTSSLASPG